LFLCGGAFDAAVHAEQFHLNGRINKSKNFVPLRASVLLSIVINSFVAIFYSNTVL
jgi:hypothetical protein